MESVFVGLVVFIVFYFVVFDFIVFLVSYIKSKHGKCLEEQGIDGRLVWKPIFFKMEVAFLIRDPEEKYKEIEEVLKAGANPNKKTGWLKWIDTNPLWAVGGNKKLVELFLRYGADVKKRPYIANVVSCRILADKNPRKEWLNFHNEHPEVSIYNEADIFDAVKLLLEKGADVNMKCTGDNKILFPATDWNYKRYFNKHGKSAINYCIKENYLLLFPLLIEYGAKLDEDSLKLAEETTERTGSTEMEDLVKKQWAIQSQLH